MMSSGLTAKKNQKIITKQQSYGAKLPNPTTKDNKGEKETLPVASKGIYERKGRDRTKQLDLQTIIQVIAVSTTVMKITIEDKQ